MLRFGTSVKRGAAWAVSPTRTVATVVAKSGSRARSVASSPRISSRSERPRNVRVSILPRPCTATSASPLVTTRFICDGSTPSSWESRSTSESDERSATVTAAVGTSASPSLPASCKNDRNRWKSSSLSVSPRTFRRRNWGIDSASRSRIDEKPEMVPVCANSHCR